MANWHIALKESVHFTCMKSANTYWNGKYIYYTGKTLSFFFGVDFFRNRNQHSHRSHALTQLCNFIWIIFKASYCCRTEHTCEFALAIGCHTNQTHTHTHIQLVCLVFSLRYLFSVTSECINVSGAFIGGIEPIRNETQKKARWSWRKSKHSNHIHLLCNVTRHSIVQKKKKKTIF